MMALLKYQAICLGKADFYSGENFKLQILHKIYIKKYWVSIEPYWLGAFHYCFYGDLRGNDRYMHQRLKILTFNLYSFDIGFFILLDPFIVYFVRILLSVR